jgi:hypothetical protein
MQSYVAIQCNGMLPPSAITKGCAKSHSRRRRVRWRSRGRSGRCRSQALESKVQIADYSSRTPFKLCIGSFHLSSQVLAETELFIMQRDKQVHFCVCAGLRSSCRGGRGWLPLGISGCLVPGRAGNRAAIHEERWAAAGKYCFKRDTSQRCKPRPQAAPATSDREPHQSSGG